MWNTLNDAKKLWTGRSPYARRWLIGAVVAEFGLCLIAGIDPSLRLVGSYGRWTNQEAMALVAMALLLVSGLVMHELDECCSGWGFVHTYKDKGGKHESDEQKYVGSVLTAESIRAAMTAAILIALLTDRDRYLPAMKAPHPPYRLPFEAIATSPPDAFFFLVVGALASSLVSTMAALLCYEYVTRFTWQDDRPKVDLKIKAFNLSKFGFYGLMWALAAIPALLDYTLAFGGTFFVFLVMWLYYFFDVPKQPKVAAAGS